MTQLAERLPTAPGAEKVMGQVSAGTVALDGVARALHEQQHYMPDKIDERVTEAAEIDSLNVIG